MTIGLFTRYPRDLWTGAEGVVLPERITLATWWFGLSPAASVMEELWRRNGAWPNTLRELLICAARAVSMAADANLRARSPALLLNALGSAGTRPGSTV